MDIRTIQARLNEIGFGPLDEDGKSGPRTKAAIKRFQAAHALVADGIAGPLTQAVLFPAAAPSDPDPSEPIAFVFPSYDDLRPTFPSARPDILRSYCEALPKIGDASGINTVARLGHFIGQCGEESDHFKTREEYASGAAYEGRHDLGNIEPGDGVRFKGRAEIQCTGRAHYGEATAYVRRVLDDPTIDLVANPALIVERADISIAVDCWYWTQGSQHYGNLNLQADKDHGDNASFLAASIAITHAIDGGENGLAERRRLTLAVKRVLARLNGH